MVFSANRTPPLDRQDETAENGKSKERQNMYLLILFIAIVVIAFTIDLQREDHTR